MKDIILPEDDIIYNFNEDYKKRFRVQIIKNRITELSHDLVQIQCGAVFDDKDSRVQEFKTLHNELRLLTGKAPRVYQ